MLFQECHDELQTAPRETKMPGCYDLSLDFVEFECPCHDNHFVTHLVIHRNDFLDLLGNLLFEFWIQILYFQIFFNDLAEQKSTDSDSVCFFVDNDGILKQFEVIASI